MKLMTITIRLSLLVLLSATLISCGVFRLNSQQNVAATVQPTSFSSTPKPPIKIIVTPSVMPSAPAPAPSQSNTPVCIALSSTASSDGWDCVNQRYGFTVHFPSTASIARTTDDVVEIWLQNSPSNPRIDRSLSISSEEKAASCISSDLKKKRVGEHDFVVNSGFEPSGVVYAWKSYAIAKESKKVCFMFVVGFREWRQDDPLFPPEEDQGLDELEAILETFRWLDP